MYFSCSLAWLQVRLGFWMWCYQNRSSPFFSEDRFLSHSNSNNAVFMHMCVCVRARVCYRAYCFFSLFIAYTAKLIGQQSCKTKGDSNNYSITVSCNTITQLLFSSVIYPITKKPNNIAAKNNKHRLFCHWNHLKSWQMTYSGSDKRKTASVRSQQH